MPGLIQLIAQTEVAEEKYLNGRKYIERRFASGELHSLFFPAVEYDDGEYIWYRNGNKHRDPCPITGICGPTHEQLDGTKMWYMHGLLHRADGPAVMRPGGIMEYWLNGKRYTETKFKELTKLETRREPITGAEMDAHHKTRPLMPVISGNYDKHFQTKCMFTGRVTKDFYYLGTELHRLDGPAVMCDGGELWYIDGVRYTQEQHKCMVNEIKKQLKHVRIDGKEYYVKNIQFL